MAEALDEELPEAPIAEPSMPARRPGAGSRLVLDALSVPLTFGPGLVAWGSFFALFASLPSLAHRLACVAVAPVYVSALFLSCVWLLRLALPRLRTGTHPLKLSVPVLAWYCHLALNRAPDVAGLRYPLNALFVTKYLLWRALGARIAFGVGTSLSCVWTDWPLIEIGPGALFGGNVSLSCHAIQGDKLVLLPIKIGADVFVGMNCVVGPGTRIGDGCWVGYGNLMAGERLKAGTRVEAGAWAEGNPRRAKALREVRAREARA